MINTAMETKRARGRWLVAMVTGGYSDRWLYWLGVVARVQCAGACEPYRVQSGKEGGLEQVSLLDGVANEG